MKKLIVSLFLLLSVFGFSQTDGTLTFTFTTPKHTSGNYSTSGAYVLAVWIETSAGTFVKTKLRYVGSGTNDHLPTWGTAAGCSNPNNATSTTCNITDATTGATQTTFPSRTVIWDGKNTNGSSNGTTVADGTYRVAIQETWGHGTATTTRYITFTKGTAIDSQTPAADGNFTAISLKWVPFALGVSDISLRPQLSIAPNPSKGNININLKNETNYIIVYSLDGKIVYNEDLKNTNILSKEIDLSFLPNGEYFVSVSNAYGSSYSKIIIAK
jgi:hypothetical protein